jgi:hypothetical protein
MEELSKIATGAANSMIIYYLYFMAYVLEDKK